jgi:hypothetical protein
MTRKTRAEILPLEVETPNRTLAGSDEEKYVISSSFYLWWTYLRSSTTDDHPAEDSNINVMKDPCPNPYLAPLYQNLPVLP